MLRSCLLSCQFARTWTRLVHKPQLGQGLTSSTATPPFAAKPPLGIESLLSQKPQLPPRSVHLLL